MCDIALGLSGAGLEQFAARLNASYMSQWAELGLYEDVEGWGPAFHQVVLNTLRVGGRIHFNLNDVNIAEALAGNPEEYVGRYTSYELQQILLDRAWFNSTVFYIDGTPLTPEQLAAVGITQP
jgi:hypothetical protein